MWKRIIFIVVLLLLFTSCTNIYPNGRVAFSIAYDNSISNLSINGMKIEKDLVYYTHKGYLEMIYYRNTYFGWVEERKKVKILKSERYFLNKDGLIKMKKGQNLIYE